MNKVESLLRKKSNVFQNNGNLEIPKFDENTNADDLDEIFGILDDFLDEIKSAQESINDLLSSNIERRRRV